MFAFLRIERPTMQILRPRPIGDVDRLLHAMHVRRERGDEDPSFAQREDLAERLPDDALRGCEPGPLRVGRVAEEQVDAAVAELCELADVGLEAVDRRVVELVVAGVDDPPSRGLEHDRGRVRDRMRHPDELDRNGPSSRGGSSGCTSRSSAARRSPCSSSFDLIRPEGQPRRPDLGDSTSRIRYGSEPTWSSWPWVRITARIESRTVAEVGEVRQDEVDAQVLVAWEGEAGVDDDDLALAS